MSYAYKATQVPEILTPTTPAVGSGGSSGPPQTPSLPIFQGQSAGLSNAVNQLAQWLMALGQAGSYAILAGLTLSNPSGLNVQVATGVALLDGIVDIVASGAQVPYQANQPAPYTLPDNSTSFIWLTQTAAGAVAVASTTSVGTPPTNGKLYLATVVTSGGAVTSIDYSGVVSLTGLEFTRQTADIGPPTDTPPIPGIMTLTTTGYYRWGGGSHTALPAPANVQTISSTLTLTALSSRGQLLTASGGNQILKLPALTALEPGASFFIWNQGASNNITVQTWAGGSISGGLVLTPGQAVRVFVCTSAGTNSWPASGVTPVTPSTGGSPG